MPAHQDKLDLDPNEPEETTSKKSKSEKPRAEKDRADRDKPEKGKSEKRARERDDDEDEKKPRKKKESRELVVGNRKVPYPPSPTDVPEGLTDFPESFVRQQNLLLAGLIAFLTFYIGALLFSILIGVWCVWSLWHWFPLKVAGIVASSTVFLFLVKGFFKRRPINKDMSIEITEDEHPLLFAFIHELCEELDAPLPNKVYVSPDVNAAVIQRVSVMNLFVEPKRDLLIGLGRVNCSNLSEFKSMLAHEFGHFSHLGRTSTYTPIVLQIIIDLITGEDWLDRVANWCKAQQNVFSIIGYPLAGMLWLGRTILWWIFKAIALQEMVVSREREFHADLVAVKAAGSDAVPFRLMRAVFGMQCFMQAIDDIAIAMDHKLYSNDLFLHQDRAAAVVRRKNKDPMMGIPPHVDHPTAGKKIQVFDPTEEDPVDNVPEMERTHPPNHEREANAKKIFVPAVIDHRSPWLLFDDIAELKERITYKFYRTIFRIPKNTELTDAKEVQRFIDNEHADTTYDPKYKGAYDERILEPGDLSELNGIINDNPWAEERMEKVLEKLYDGCEEHAEAHSELYKERELLESRIVGRPSPRMKRKLAELDKKQEENRDWFKSFDRRVYLLHVQMAAQVDKTLKDELVERYRFQLEVQRFFQDSRHAFNKADAYMTVLFQSEPNSLPPDFVGEVIQVLRESWKTLKNIIKSAREINLPAMKNFEEGDNLAEFILEGKMVPEPPLSYVKGVWIDKLMKQLNGVKNKCFRLHFKSVGGILRLQEEIAAKWQALREPVAAEVVDVIPAEVVAAEPVAAEVIPAEPIAAEVIPAESPAPPVPPPEPPKAVVAPPPVAEVPPPAPPPAPSVVSAPEPEPEPVVAAEPPDAPVAPAVAETFALDADAAAAPAEPSPAAPPITPAPTPAAATAVSADEIFSLEADAAKPTAAVASDTPFSLDADDYAAKPAAPSITAAVKPAEPEPVEPEPVAAQPASSASVLSGVATVPAARNGTPTAPAASVLPANGKRPRLKITLLRPGQPSPLAK